MWSMYLSAGSVSPMQSSTFVRKARMTSICSTVISPVELGIAFLNRSLNDCCSSNAIVHFHSPPWRLVKSRNFKLLNGLHSSAVFAPDSTSIACRAEGFNWSGTILDGLVLGHSVTSIWGHSASSHGDKFPLMPTGVACSSPGSEGEPQSETAALENSKRSAKTTIYDILETEKITEVFPDLDFALEGNFYPKLVPFIARKIRNYFDDVGGENRASDLLEILGIKLTPHLVGEVMKLLKYQPRKARMFFKWAGSQDGFEHTSHTYNLQLWVLVNLKDDVPGRLVLCQIHLEEMLAKNFVPDSVACNVLITRLCKDGKAGAALKLARTLARKDFPDSFTYNSLITGLGKTLLLKEVYDQVDEMKKKGCTPNLVTYNCLINVFSKAGRFKAVFSILDEMVEKGFTPDLLTYNTLIYGLGTAGRWQQAWKIFESLPEKEITPDIVSYNSLIVGLFHCREVQEAYKVFDLMNLRGCQPNEITYNTFVDGLMKCGFPDQAWNIFHSMGQFGVNPDVVTYNTMISGLVSLGKMDDALGLLTKMKENGCTPNAVTFKLLGVNLEEVLEIPDLLSRSRKGTEEMTLEVEDFSGDTSQLNSNDNKSDTERRFSNTRPIQ